MLRALQLGISIAELELITIGMLIDMYNEALFDVSDDECDVRLATQTDIDNF